MVDGQPGKMNKLKILTCDACGNDNLCEKYTVKGSLRGNKVYICKRCGLIQSKNELSYDESKNEHSLAYTGNRMRLPNSGPTWGNIRHGKELRLNSHKKYLEGLDFKKFKYILDDGSNRGAFLEWLFKKIDQTC